MNKRLIAIIYEGEKAERQLVANLNQCFFSKFTQLKPIVFPAGENIYMLWQQLKKDEFQTDVIEVLREYNSTAKKSLEGYSRDDFMEIYLFFDYDGHTNNIKGSIADAMEEMLDTFSDETDLGKLYINYPMVESIRDNLTEEFCFRRCSVALKEVGDYKHTVCNMHTYQDFRKYKEKDWAVFCRNAVRKLNCIMESGYIAPERSDFLDRMGQAALFQKQQEKYIKMGKIAILNSFPLFLLEYFPKDFWKKMLFDRGE